MTAAALRDTHLQQDKYAQIWLPVYLGTDFFRMFRMLRKAF